MFRKIVAACAGASSALWWVTRETIRTWFFEKLLHMMEIPTFWGGVVQYLPPALFLTLTVYLLIPRNISNDSATPTMLLEDVVKRAIRKGQLPLATEPESVEVLRVCDSLREKALHGKIIVFGGINWRTTLPKDYDTMVRDRITAEYWRDHRIDVIGFLGSDDHRGRTSPLADAGTSGDDYYGLWFDRRQIDAIWPAPWPKIDWRHPINWKTT